MKKENRLLHTAYQEMRWREGFYDLNDNETPDPGLAGGGGERIAIKKWSGSRQTGTSSANRAISSLLESREGKVKR